MKIIYISQGNIPSRWAHTVQAMKMAEALAGQVDSLTMLTGGGLLSSQSSTVDLAEWYGTRHYFHIVRLPVHWRLDEPFFTGYRYPRFDRAAALYSRLKSPALVFTRSPYAGYLCVRLRLSTIIETHMEADHPEFQRVIAACRMPHLRGVVTITDYLKNAYIKAGVPESKILVWPDAVDLSGFSDLPSQQMSRDELGLPSAARIATYCGHFYEHKGVSYIIAAAKYLPDVLFCLVGGWPRDIELYQKQAKGLTNLHFSGFVPYEKVNEYLLASDLLLLPNSMQYKQAYSTSPLKLFEYMAARRPIIASNIPAFQGLLRHRENAYLIEPDSAAAIVSAIQVLADDLDLSARIVEQAWEDVQQFTWARRATDILSYFLG